MKLAYWIAMGLAVALAGCEEPTSRDIETAPPMEAPVAPAAEDAGVPAADTQVPTDQPALDDTTLPPSNPSSEQSVRPESETLFY
jgi:hypothetical protein